MRYALNCSIYLIIFIAFFVGPSLGSPGDRTQFFRNCRQNCERFNCTADGVEIQEHAVKYYGQTIFDWTWSCEDECLYGCVWKTVDAFLERNWKVPQFYGKWPFVRFLGMQEPASVFFSILNLVAHVRALRQFRREVRKDSPCFFLWHFFALVCCNGWIWSSVFHARDFPMTELLDYVFAYSIVLTTLYCMIMRMMVDLPIYLRILVSLIFLSFFLNYFAYVSAGQFSYSWNMMLNIATGTLSALGWFAWSYFVSKTRPYYKGIVRFYIMFGMAMSLELLDFPPIFWTFDAHSLWHLATVPLVSVFYSFVIEDCKRLRKDRELYGRSHFNKTI